MAACHKELSMYIGVDHRDHALVIRQLNFEIVADLNYPATLAFHSTFHIGRFSKVTIINFQHVDNNKLQSQFNA